MGRSMAEITPELVRTMPASAEVYDRKDWTVISKSIPRTASFTKASTRQTPTARIFSATRTRSIGSLARESTDSGLCSRATAICFRRPSLTIQNPRNGASRRVTNSAITASTGPFLQVASPATAGALGLLPRPMAALRASLLDNCQSAARTAMGREPRTSATWSQSGCNWQRPRGPIVNPATLNLDLANNICMSCHPNGRRARFKRARPIRTSGPGQPLTTCFRF